MELVKVGELGAEDIRDADFLDEDRLVLIGAAADLFEYGWGSAARSLRCSGRKVLAPVARALRVWRLEPAGGGYPRVVALRRSDLLVVNTHDLVLVACDLAHPRRPRLLSDCWGEYDPTLRRSSEGALFSAAADQLLVFETATWARYCREGLCVCAWHPDRRLLLVLDGAGRLGWLDFEASLGSPAYRLLGDLAGRVDLLSDVPDLAVDPSGTTCLLAFEAGRLEWWQLQPLRLIDARQNGDGRVFGLCSATRTGQVAVESEAGLRLWDMSAHSPSTCVVPGVSGVRLSPSGRRVVARERASTTPHPSWGGGQQAGAIVLWELR